MTLQSIEEHNGERREWWAAGNTIFISDVACPECGAGLFVNWVLDLTKHPPETPAMCSICDWRGSILA